MIVRNQHPINFELMDRSIYFVRLSVNKRAKELLRSLFISFHSHFNDQLFRVHGGTVYFVST